MYLEFNLTNKHNYEHPVRYSDLQESGRQFVNFYEYSCGTKIFLLILEAPKFTYARNLDIYENIIQTFKTCLLMYKILFFLHKPVDENFLNHFKEKTIKTLSELSGKEIFIAEVESNLLADKKFSYFCETEFIRKMKWIKL